MISASSQTLTTYRSAEGITLQDLLDLAEPYPSRCSRTDSDDTWHGPGGWLLSWQLRAGYAPDDTEEIINTYEKYYTEEIRGWRSQAWQRWTEDQWKKYIEDAPRVSKLVGETADQVKSRTDIYAVAQSLGIERGRRNGMRVNVRCPVHKEKTASCVFYLDTQHFHCFGCGAHGDVFTLVQKKLNIPFKFALDYLKQL